MQRLNNPLPLFINARGGLLDAGFVYVGEADKDPEDYPLDLYLDPELTVPIDQPLRTIGGMIVSGMSPVFVYMAEADYSIRTREADGEQVTYIASTAVSGVAYQPLDSDLTAIAALSTTTFGRNLLTLANSAALKAQTGIPDCLPLSGGTVTGTITRSGSGAHLYHADAAMTGGRVFITAPDAADPTSAAGDIWLKTAS